MRVQKGRQLQPQAMTEIMPLTPNRVNTYIPTFTLFYSRAGCEGTKGDLSQLVILIPVSAGSDLLALRAPVFQNVNALFHSGINPVSVEAVFGQQQLRVSVGNQPIGYPHADDAQLVL